MDFKLIMDLNTAKSIDIISSNGDRVIGQPTNHLLAAANRGAKLRFIQSVHENHDNNSTIDKILFEFGNNVEHILIYDNDGYSCIIIDNNIAFEFRADISKNKNSEVNSQDVRIISNTFEELWSIHSRDHKIQSIKQAINSISNRGLRKGDFVFRGQNNCEWELVPSLLRNCEMIEAMEEAKCLKPLFHREYIPFLNTIDPIEYFVNCQHYGIKTRLLDFTRDILIGLFFACYDPLLEHEDKDGKLFVVECKQFPEFDFNLKDGSMFKHRITMDNVELFKNRIKVEYPTIFEPFIKNPRMRFQEGVFIFFPYFIDDGKYISLEKYIKKWNIGIDDPDKKYWIAHKLVDKQFKKYILKQLKQEYGIDAESIFVETTLSKNLKENLFNAINKDFSFPNQ